MTSTQRATGPLHATTILAVRQGGTVAMAGDGQVTVGEMVMKHHARKIRRLRDGRVLAGFAGSTADALTLFDKFESNLDRYGGNLRRAAVELTREWRTDKFLRRLEAMLLVADRDQLLVLTGDGDVIEPDDGVAAIGSGGSYAQAAARALVRHTDLSAAQIARAAMEIAAAMCIYTNDALVLFTLDDAAPTAGPDADGAERADAQATGAGQHADGRAVAERATAGPDADGAERADAQPTGAGQHADGRAVAERATAEQTVAERANSGRGGEKRPRVPANAERTGTERPGAAAGDPTAARGAGT